MLWTIFVILLVLWLLGLVSSYTLGGFIHILLVVAIAIALFVGGVAGSVYVSGAAATVSSVGSAITGAAAVVPGAATGAAAVVAATSAPILVGVAGGAVVGYLLYSLAN